MFGGALPLKFILVAVGTTATMLVTLFLAYSFHDLATLKMTEQIGNSVAVLADQLDYRLESELQERSHHLKATSKLVVPLLGGEPAKIIALLDYARAYSDLNRITLFDLQGRKLGTSGRSPPSGRDGDGNVVDLFVKPAAGNVAVRESQAMLVNFEDSDSATSPGHLMLSAPVLDPNGQRIAVLVASFDWDWAEELGRSLGGHLPAMQAMQLLVVTNKGRMLVGPAKAGEGIQNVTAFKQALTSVNGFNVELWPGGEEYLTGFAKSEKNRFADGQYWIVLVRQDASSALAPVRKVQRSVIVYAILFALHAIVTQWLLAKHIVHPLGQISHAADELRRNGQTEIPLVAQFAEVQSLSSSLIALVDALKTRERALETLSSSLERQVAERTAALAEQNQALEEAREVAEQATAAKTRFLAAASHDLRQPMQALGLFANALSTRLVGTDSAPIVRNLEQSLASLGNMFDALLHISRLDAGLIVGELSHVSLKAIMTRMTAEFQLEAEHRGLRFRCMIPDLQIVTEPVLFEVIIRNLVSNALKFTKQGGLLLGVRRRGQNVAIEIYDTGVGISDDQLDTIFVEFERAKWQATGPNDGLGLGLSVASRYATLIGAKIAVRSRLGHGTRFSVVVPKADGVNADSASPKTQSKLSGLHIMLVDDNARHLQSLSLFLRDRGALVSTFETAQAALLALRGGLTIDVAVLDYDLGDTMTGVDFLGPRHAGQYEFEAVFLTGRTDALAISAMTQTGRAWISKPAEPDMIAAIIGRLAARAGRTDHHSAAV